MRKLIHKAIPAVLLLPLSMVAATAMADPSATLDQARELHQQALALEHGWAVTEPLIAEARAAIEAGNAEEANTLANRALLVAEQSLKQAESEKNAWQARVVGR